MKQKSITQQIISGMLSHQYHGDYWKSTSIEFKELLMADSIIQNDGKSVKEHIMLVVQLLLIKNPVTIFSALFHDLGKIYTKSQKQIAPKFLGHAQKSAQIAKKKLIEWNASDSLIERVLRIVSTHMYDIKNITKDRSILKFIADVGSDNIENWFVLRIADSRAYKKYNNYYRYIIHPFKLLVDQHLQKAHVNKNNLYNTGNYTMIKIEGGNE